MPSLRSFALLVAATATSACGHHIGDSCSTNVDCSPLGDRFCDVAAIGGYCTIEGCDVRLDSSGNQVDTCTKAAGESVCVRFFTLEQNKPCDPATSSASCSADERCLCNCTDPVHPGACLPTTDPRCANAAPVQQPDMGIGPLGHCSKAASERRWCMLKCNSDGDCRASYKCVPAGTNGAEPVPRNLQPIYSSGTQGPIPDGGLIGTGDYSQKFCLYRP